MKLCRFVFRIVFSLTCRGYERVRGREKEKRRRKRRRNLSTLNKILTVDFFINVLYQVEKAPLYFYSLIVFNH